MKKAYIILAHKNPEQLCRLLDRLDDGNSTIYLHIDKKIPLSDFCGLEAFGDKIKLVERVPSYWGDMGNVRATLNAMKAIRQSGEQFGQVILLSGQDYPIKTAEEIDRAYSESPYSIFLEYWPLPDYNRWPNLTGGMYRVNKYYYGMKPHQLFLSKSRNFIGNVFPPLARKVPRHLEPYSGSTWFSVDMYGLNYILDYVENNKWYLSYHKRTFCSDEVFFQMILLNSNDENLERRIENNNKRFIKWQTTTIAHPDILKKDDIQEIMKSDALFARKFDINEDEEILDLIDVNCLAIELA